MIIKKQAAARYGLPKPQPEPVPGSHSVEASNQFETVGERRRQDRRQGYRRDDDHELVSRAEEEANAIREKAEQEGYEAGIAQAQDTIAELHDSMQTLLNAKEKALEAVIHDLGGMAVEIAERLIKTEVACDPDLVLSVVRDTIRKVSRDQKSILVKVHPSDLAFVKTSLKEDSGVSESVEVMVTEDAAIDPGSCIIETRAGQIDASFQTQLAVLKHLLMVKRE